MDFRKNTGTKTQPHTGCGGPNCENIQHLGTDLHTSTTQSGGNPCSSATILITVEPKPFIYQTLKQV